MPSHSVIGAAVGRRSLVRVTPHAAPPTARALPRVLVVCTGNVCRSPFAELLLRSRVPGLEIASRGIDALEGSAMEGQMRALLEARDVDASGFRARQVEAADVDADLVLTMSARQRAYLLDEFPQIARRTGLLGAVPALQGMAEEQGGLSPSLIAAWTRRPVGRQHEVPDPYRRPLEAARATADLLESLVDPLAALLTGTAAAPAPPTPR